MAELPTGIVTFLFPDIDDSTRLWEQHPTAMPVITSDNARSYGRWLGQRYCSEPHIVWSNGFDLQPWLFEEIALEFAAGLQEGGGAAFWRAAGTHAVGDGGTRAAGPGAGPRAPGRLITYHPCGGANSSYFHHQPWLAANFIQTWADYLRIYPMVHYDCLRTPAKPVVHVEGAYEDGPEYPTGPITPLLVRRQAYWAYLAGGFHTYGHNDMWRHNPTWQQSLDSPGAQHMAVLKRILTAREWWKHVPDQSILALGAGGDKLLNAAAWSSDGDGVILYLSHPTTVSLHMEKITAAATVRARWVNSETGEETVIGEFPNTGTRAFMTPESRPDAVLLLDAV